LLSFTLLERQWQVWDCCGRPGLVPNANCSVCPAVTYLSASGGNIAVSQLP